MKRSGRIIFLIENIMGHILHFLKNVYVDWAIQWNSTQKYFIEKFSLPPRDRWSIQYQIPLTKGMPWNSMKKYFVEKYFLPVIVDQFCTKFPWQKACRGFLRKNISWKNISFPWSLIKNISSKNISFPWSLIKNISSKNISLPWSLINSVPNLLHKRHAVEFYEKIFHRKTFPPHASTDEILRKNLRKTSPPGVRSPIT